MSRIGCAQPSRLYGYTAGADLENFGELTVLLPTRQGLMDNVIALSSAICGRLHTLDNAPLCTY